MALRKNVYITPNGYDNEASLTNAYIKVESVNGSKQKLIATVSFLNDKTSPAIKAETKAYVFIPSMDNKNFIAQAYTYLKTLPEFDDAVDC